LFTYCNTHKIEAYRFIICFSANFVYLSFHREQR